jgi:hypothetical protein
MPQTSVHEELWFSLRCIQTHTSQLNVLHTPWQTVPAELVESMAMAGRGKKAAVH